MKYFAALLITIYLGTAPVYWLPYIDVSVFSWIKLTFIAAPVVLIWSVSFAENKFLLPTGMTGPVGLLILIASASFAFIQAKEGFIVKRLMDMLLGFVMMWSFYLYSRNNVNIKNILRNAAIIISVLCWITVFNKFIDIPSWRSPVIFGSNMLYISGFGALRTGWSNGISLFVPILLLLISDNKITIKSGLLSFVLVLGIIMSQIVVAGRAGLITSLAAIIIFSLIRLKKIYVISFAVLAALLMVVFSDFLIVQFRIDRLEGDVISTESLDHFSAGRIDSYLIALKMMVDKPVTGYGFGYAIINDREIHNFWLRMLVEGGMFLPIVFMFVVLAILKHVRKQFYVLKRIHGANDSDLLRKLYNTKNIGFCVLLILIGGLIESFFEPNIFLGSFQNTAIWWAVAGIAISMHEQLLRNEQDFSLDLQKKTKSIENSIDDNDAKKGQSVRLRKG